MNIIKSSFTLLCSFLALSAFAGEKVDQQLAIDANSNITIENVRGEIAITGWDKNTVTVKGELDEKAEKFIFEKTDNGILIKVVTPRDIGRGSYSNQDGSNLIINVPENARVHFEGISTDVTAKNLQRGTELKSISGEVNAAKLSDHVDISTVSGYIVSENLSGKISLNTVSGDIKDKNSRGRLRIESVSGNIESTSSASTVSAHNVSGEIKLALQKIDELQLNTVSDDISVSLSLNNDGIIKASSVSGDIELLFQNDVQASFRLNSSVNDDISNKLTDKKAKTAKYGPGAKLNFETGNGNGSVRINTVSGDIEVAKK
jgi:putative adhesin